MKVVKFLCAMKSYPKKNRKVEKMSQKCNENCQRKMKENKAQTLNKFSRKRNFSVKRAYIMTCKVIFHHSFNYPQNSCSSDMRTLRYSYFQQS